MNRTHLANLIARFLPRRARSLVWHVNDAIQSQKPRPAPLPRFPSIEASLVWIRDRGFEPRGAVDVGAYEGEFATLFHRIFPDTPILMVEPMEKKVDILRSVAASLPKQSSVRSVLLGAETGTEVTFHEMETGSSAFDEQSPYARNARQMHTTTLADAVNDWPVTPNFVKLDTQGYELEILKGSDLSSFEVILTEASLIPINKGCPDMAQVVEFLSSRGFRLVDFCSMVRRLDGALWQTDLLFVREGSSLLPEPRLTAENWGTAKIRSETNMSIPPSLRSD